MKAGSRILAAACIAEALTGVALLMAPSFIASILLGAELDALTLVVGRIAGVALVALAIACWPNPQLASRGAYAGMLLYNILVPLLLADAALDGAARSPWLWPTIILHGVMAMLLGGAWFTARDNLSGRVRMSRREG